jgi:predicted butyrate kinase (DUF1464 family)
MEEPKLQPLRITAGWKVEWNLFYEVDISEETLTYLDSSSLLHLENHQLMRAINLDFRPENDVNGYFYLRVINLTTVENPKTKKIDFRGDWENLYFEFKSKKRKEVVEQIERLVVQTPPFKSKK